MKKPSRSAPDPSEPADTQPASTGACALPADAGRQALQASSLFLLLTALVLALLAPAAGGQEATAPGDSAEPATDTASRNIVPLGPDGLPEPRRQLPDLGRLQRQLQQEALIEGFLGESDLRDIVAVRAYVDRTGRVAERSIHDHARQFDDSRSAVQQMAKEAAREYVKMRIGWDAMQDRMKVRLRNLVRRDGGADLPAERYGAAPAAPAAPTASPAGGWGAIEVGPELSLDSDDAEVGLDFDYDPGRTNFLSRWNLYYGRTVESNQDLLRLRYDNSDTKRWFEFRAGRGDEDAGDYVAISMTALF